MGPTRAHRWWSLVPVASLLVLAGLTVDRLSLEPPEDAAPYHERVRVAVEAIPPRLGDWRAEEVPVPPAATQLLRPNVLLSRRYRNVVSGVRADFLLVQCGDARDMQAHYPPICYHNQGWRMQVSRPRDWTVDGRVFQGIEYEFTINSFDRPGTIIINNFFVMPDGQIMRDMRAVDHAAKDLKRRFYGSSQIQVVFDVSVPQHQRDLVTEELLRMYMPVLETIRTGVQS